MDGLRQMLADNLLHQTVLEDFELHPSDGKRLSWLAANGEIVSRTDSEGVVRLRVRLPERAVAQFRAL